MSGYRKLASVAAVATAIVALAIAFTGAASGASAPSLPSGAVSVHADPGHVSTRLIGTGCGGFITVHASGGKGGSGVVACGHTSAWVAAYPGGTNYAYASPSQSAILCQANALFASHGVDVVCTENAD